jgi:hypothetical protein
MIESVIKLELCREAGNGASIAATFDLIFSISSNNRAFVMKPASGIALHKQRQLVDLRGLFLCLQG